MVNIFFLVMIFGFVCQPASAQTYLSRAEIRKKYQNICELISSAKIEKKSRYLVSPVESNYIFYYLNRGNCIRWKSADDSSVDVKICRSDSQPAKKNEAQFYALTQGVLKMLNQMISGKSEAHRKFEYSLGVVTASAADITEFGGLLKSLRLVFNENGDLRRLQLQMGAEQTDIEFRGVRVSKCAGLK